MAKRKANGKRETAPEPISNSAGGPDVPLQSEGDQMDTNLEGNDQADGEEQDGSEQSSSEQSDAPTSDAPTSEPGETRAVLDPITQRSWFSEETEAAIRAAIEAGDVFTVPAKVTIRKQKSPTKRDEVQPFIAYFANTVAGAITLSGGKEEPSKDAPETGDDTRTPAEKQLGACDHFNYGFGLKSYQNPIRGMLEDLIAGPEKQIAKLVKQLVDGKMADNEVEAREMVIASRKKKGLPVPIGDQ